MRYDTVKNCKWANAEHTLIDCEVDFDMLKEEFVPFTAMASGDTAHGHEIFARAVAGDFGPIAEYAPPAPPTSEELAFFARSERDRMLAASDWTQLPDNPQSLKDTWAPYRQALRDITDQPGFPETIDWPVAPN